MNNWRAFVADRPAGGGEFGSAWFCLPWLPGPIIGCCCLVIGAYLVNRRLAERFERTRPALAISTLLAGCFPLPAS